MASAALSSVFAAVEPFFQWALFESNAPAMLGSLVFTEPLSSTTGAEERNRAEVAPGWA